MPALPGKQSPGLRQSDQYAVRHVATDPAEYTQMSPKYIDLTPPGEDLLVARPQARIASRVCRLIAQRASPTHLIGLDGEWGAGKSNVIGIIERTLHTSHHVFVYDAWGHQEDLQRRAFLEELTDSLCASKTINPPKWNEKLKDLLATRRETTIRTTPRLSIGVVATAFLAALTPILKSVSEVTTDVPILRLTISLLPLIAGVVMWTIGSFRAKHVLRPNEVYRLYREHDSRTDTSIRISERQPSVREFQSWMRGLSQDLTDRQLIIVFDNIDRLPHDRVHELWSSIHTFFAAESFPGVFVVVPFDSQRLAKALGYKDPNELLSKTFSVIFRVAPPVLTDWHEFFRSKFREAFGEDTSDVIAAVMRIFDRLSPAITPRTVIAFINELVSLQFTADEDVELPYMAVFALTSDTIMSDPVGNILSLEFLGPLKTQFQSDQKIQDQIASLVYHVPVSVASQVTLSRAVAAMLLEGNVAALNQLTQHAHFAEVLEETINADGIDVENAVAVLSAFGDQSSSQKSSRLRRMWTTLGRLALRTDLKSQNFTATQEQMLTNTGGSVRMLLLQHIVESIRDWHDFDGGRYYGSLASLTRFAAEQNIGVRIEDLLGEVTMQPDALVQYLQAAKDDHRAFMPLFDGYKVDEYVDEHVPDKTDGLHVLSVLRKYDHDTEPWKEALKNAITSGVVNAQNVGPSYRFYRSLELHDVTLLSDQEVISLMDTMGREDDGYFDLVAMRIARCDQFPGNQTTEEVLQVTDSEFVEAVADRLEYFADYGDMVLGLLSWPTPLLKSVLQSLTLEHSRTSRMNIERVLPHFDEICVSLEVLPSDLLYRLNDWVRLAREKVSTDNIADMVSQTGLFDAAVQSDTDLADFLVTTMTTHLAALHIDTWREILGDETSYYFRVVVSLLGARRLNTLPDDGVAAYKEVLVNMANGTIGLMSDDVGWDVIYDRVNKNKLKATIKNIRDLFIGSVPIDCPRFRLFIDMMVDHGDLDSRSGDVARKILTPVANDTSCLQVISDRRRYFSKLIKASGDDGFDFRDTVRRAANTAGEDEALIEFAAMIGVAADERTE